MLFDVVGNIFFAFNVQPKISGLCKYVLPLAKTVLQWSKFLFSSPWNKLGFPSQIVCTSDCLILRTHYLGEHNRENSELGLHDASLHQKQIIW